MTLLPTDFLPIRGESFQALRYMMQCLAIQNGVVGGSYGVSQHAGGANMSVDVGGGDAWIAGTSTSRQGMYHQGSDATVNVSINASDLTNPRLDQVVLTINDSSSAGASDTPFLQTLPGTPTAGTTLDNRNGAVTSLPATSLRLADVLVPAGSSSVVSGNIRDRRPWALGAYAVAMSTAAASYVGGTYAEIDHNLSQRVECNGTSNSPMTMTLSGNFVPPLNTGAGIISPMVDGAAVAVATDWRYWTANGALQEGINISFPWTFTPGSHLISWRWLTTAAQTINMASAVASPSFSVVEEKVRISSNNNP